MKSTKWERERFKMKLPDNILPEFDDQMLSNVCFYKMQKCRVHQYSCSFNQLKKNDTIELLNLREKYKISETKFQQTDVKNEWVNKHIDFEKHQKRMNGILILGQDLLSSDYLSVKFVRKMFATLIKFFNDFELMRMSITIYFIVANIRLQCSCVEIIK